MAPSGGADAPGGNKKNGPIDIGFWRNKITKRKQNPRKPGQGQEKTTGAAQGGGEPVTNMPTSMLPPPAGGPALGRPGAAVKVPTIVLEPPHGPSRPPRKPPLQTGPPPPQPQFLAPKPALNDPSPAPPLPSPVVPVSTHPWQPAQVLRGPLGHQGHQGHPFGPRGPVRKPVAPPAAPTAMTGGTSGPGAEYPPSYGLPFNPTRPPPQKQVYPYTRQKQRPPPPPPPTLPPAAQQPPADPLPRSSLVNFPTKQGPLRYIPMDPDPLEAFLLGLTKEDPRPRPRRPRLPFTPFPRSPRRLRRAQIRNHNNTRAGSESSDEFVRAGPAGNDPFAAEQPTSPPRNLIDDLVWFKKYDDHSTGYPSAVMGLGVPPPRRRTSIGGLLATSSLAGLHMPIPPPGARPHRQRRRRRLPRWSSLMDPEYPGVRIGNYSMLRGGARDPWPDRVWDQDDVAALGLRPDYEGTSVLVNGSPQDLKLLGPAWEALGKIKKGPWADRFKLPRAYVSESKTDAAGGRHPEARGGSSSSSSSRSLLPPVPAPDASKKPPPDKKDLPRMSWEQLCNRGPWGTVNFEDDFSDADPEFVETIRRQRQQLLTHEQMEALLRGPKQKLAVSPPRITELADDAEEDDEEEDKEEDDVPAAPQAMMVRPGGGQDDQDCDWEADEESTAPAGPMSPRCVSCMNLGRDCSGKVPCKQCLQGSIRCRMPPWPSSDPSSYTGSTGTGSTGTGTGTGTGGGRGPADPFQTPTPGRFFPYPTLPPLDRRDVSPDVSPMSTTSGPDDGGAGSDLDGENPGRGFDLVPATEHWAADAPPAVGTGGEGRGPCDYCVARGRPGDCEANHELWLECPPCAEARVRGDLGHECRVGGETYRPRRHVATRNRYRDVNGAIVYRCEACDKGGVAVCDVDPYVRTGCSACALASRDCSWHVDRRRPPGGDNSLLMWPRVNLAALASQLGGRRLLPYWRRGCLDCLLRGVRCSWLGDYRTIRHRCEECTMNGAPCVDSEVPERPVTDQLEFGSSVFRPGGPRLRDPRIKDRGFGDRGACRTCCLIASTPGACGETYKACRGWVGGDNYACVRCTALGLPCVANFTRGRGRRAVVLPFPDRELIGYGFREPASALSFPACEHCVQDNRWCDRMRPCHECHARGLPCRIDDQGRGRGRGRGQGQWCTGLGLVPRGMLDEFRVSLPPEYWMAHGYGPDGPGGDRGRIPNDVLAGPLELTWAVYGDDVKTRRGRPGYKDVRRRKPAMAMAQGASDSSADPDEADSSRAPAAAPVFGADRAGRGLALNLDPSERQFELAPSHEGAGLEGFTGGLQRRMILLSNSSSILTGGRASGSVLGTPFTLGTTPGTAPGTAPGTGTVTAGGGGGGGNAYNRQARSFNSIQPEGTILGGNLDPFVSAKDGAARAADYDDIVLKNIALRGPGPVPSPGSDPVSSSSRDLWADISRLAYKSAGDRFAHVHLGTHEGADLGVVPDGRQVPPRERALLTLEGQDVQAVRARHPFVPAPEEADRDARVARARYLMTTWASPGIDVLRDISDGVELLPLPDRGQLCQDAKADEPLAACGNPLGRAGPSHCENRQHVAGQSTWNLRPLYVCGQCDESTTNNILGGPDALTMDDFFSMRTYACGDCAGAESRADGVVPPDEARVLTGCGCATKLLYRRLCASHRYTLAGALVVNALLVREWQVVNFPPSFCMFCKKVGHGEGGGGAHDHASCRVFFCVNCQTRVVDPAAEGTLYYGNVPGPYNTTQVDPRGVGVVTVMRKAEEDRRAVMQAASLRPAVARPDWAAVDFMVEDSAVL